MRLIFTFFVSFCATFFVLTFSVQSQQIDCSADRVNIDLQIPFKKIGTLKPRSTNEVSASRWSLGCEVLDRDYADYHSYKEYLVPLGIKKLRLQAGWAKTEQKQGQYDWTWLDTIINDAHARGLKPWLQITYGNPIYSGGGGREPGAGMPFSDEALAAWERWVEAMVLRYKDKVNEWETWNEPNQYGEIIEQKNKEFSTPEFSAKFNIRTAKIVRKHQPDAHIAGLNLAYIGNFTDYADKFFKVLADEKAFDLFNSFTYHPYARNPDDTWNKTLNLEEMLRKYNSTVPLRQGECGCPSGFHHLTALENHYWTELSQSKWLLRRTISDLGHGHETAVLGIIDMAYPVELYTLGLLRTDSSKKVLGVKKAYYAVQNAVSMFDDRIEPIPHEKIETTTKLRQSVAYAFRDKNTDARLLAIWFHPAIPSDTNELKPTKIVIEKGQFKNPVYVEMLTGGVYEIPKEQWNDDGNKQTFNNIPVYDSPVLIVDQSLVISK
ncbi:MAG: beta-galactosidase [Planctomycetaceae bacterium]|jgi:hypothetical protein|nr:beta-galactosidase [Planctomycetaceae bacterium]